MKDNSLPFSFSFSWAIHNKKNRALQITILLFFSRICKSVAMYSGRYFMAFGRNDGVEVEHAVHINFGWVCLTHSPVEPIHYTSLHNTLFYLRSISHCNYMDQVIPNVSYHTDELEFYVELSLSWSPTIKSNKTGVHSLNL